MLSLPHKREAQPWLQPSIAILDSGGAPLPGIMKDGEFYKRTF